MRVSVYISIGQVARLAGVSRSTLRRWEKEGYLSADYRTKGKHRRYHYKAVLEFLGLSRPKEQPEVFIYARVSSARQKEDLKRQIQRLRAYTKDQGWRITGLYHDVGSGLNDNRKGLLRMINHLASNTPDFLVCSYKDRMARFGTRLIEEFCGIYDVKLVETLNRTQSEEEKLAQSIIAILTSFSGKLYRSRRGKNVEPLEGTGV